MAGSGVRVERRTLTILVYEFVTGGGLAGQALPASWATEGAAMRRAIIEDFASVPGVRVISTLDARLPFEGRPGVRVRPIPDPEGSTFESLAAKADYTVLIAPETDDILRNLTRSIVKVAGRSLGPSRQAIRLVGDKVRLADHLHGHEIPTPRTLLLGPRSTNLLTHWSGPIVIKPRFGAGSVETVLVREARCPSWVNRNWSFVAQPYFIGKPMSASFLVDADGQSTLIAIGRQRIHIDDDGKITYQGGTIPSGVKECPAVVRAAVESVASFLPKPSLRGFVGVDFVVDDKGNAVVLEINPRPTTSYVGLVRLFPPGTIAGAWLAAAKGGLKGTEWPDRLRLSRETQAVSFGADGTIAPARSPR